MPLTESRKAMKRLFKSLFPDVGNHTKLYLDKLAFMGARRERGAVRPSATDSPHSFAPASSSPHNPSNPGPARGLKPSSYFNSLFSS